MLRKCHCDALDEGAREAILKWWETSTTMFIYIKGCEKEACKC